MKIEVTSDIQVEDWLSPIVIITQSEYFKADLKEIDRVVAMLCNINCFERQLTEMEHEEILKGHRKISILTPSKHLLAISKYDKSTGDFYVIERTFRARQ